MSSLFTAHFNHKRLLFLLIGSGCLLSPGTEIFLLLDLYRHILCYILKDVTSTSYINGKTEEQTSSTILGQSLKTVTMNGVAKQRKPAAKVYDFTAKRISSYFLQH